MTYTKEEIQEVFKEVVPLGSFSEMWAARRDTNWHKLFVYYNEVISATKKLNMGCYPCFGKVYSAIKKHLSV